MAEHHLSRFDYKKAEREWQALNQKEEYEMKLAQGFSVAETFLMQGYLDSFSEANIIDLADTSRLISLIRIIKISKIVFDPSELTKDKLISVYSALYHISSTVAVIINGTGKEVSFYIATRCSEGKDSLAGELLSKTLRANFPGTDFTTLDNSDTRKLVEEEQKYTGSLACVSLIPATRDDDKEKFVQGIEKLINGMMGKTYYAILLASPISYEELEQRKHGYEELYSALSPYSKTSVSYAHSESTSVNESIGWDGPLSIGLSISVEIKNDQQTVMKYFLEPIIIVFWLILKEK